MFKPLNEKGKGMAIPERTAEYLDRVLAAAEQARLLMVECNALDGQLAVGARPTFHWDDPGGYWLADQLLVTVLTSYFGGGCDFDPDGHRNQLVAQMVEAVRYETIENGESVAYNLKLFGWHHSEPGSPVTNEDIATAFIDGVLQREDFGLTEVEIRYPATLPAELVGRRRVPDDACLMVHTVLRESDWLIEQPHCDQTPADARRDGTAVQGIGGTYADGGTFSYVGDDKFLFEQIVIALQMRRVR